MRITSSIEYAARLMATLARAHGGAPLPAERLAAADNVPADYVSQILGKLRRAGLVASHRGSSGGYSLSRPPAEITLSQVVRAVDGEVFEDVCGKYDGGSRDCRRQDGCSISPVWKKLGALVSQYFESVTLAHILAERPADCGEVSSKEESMTTYERVEKVLDKVRPYIQSDGGNIALVSVDEANGIVKVSLSGACGSCPSSTATLKGGVERMIRQEIPEIKEVVAV